MADTPSSSVAAVAIVILVIAALAGGYMMFFRDAGDGNDIHIDVPGGKNK